MPSIHLVDLFVFVAYLILVILIGLRVGKGQKTLSEYFLGDRKMPWWTILGSIVATETSTVTFLSIPGITYAAGGDFRFLQLTLGYIIGRIVISFFMLPWYFRGNYFTVYEILENRFGVSTKRIASAIFLLARNASDALRLFLTALVVQEVFGANQESEALLPICIISIGILTIVYTLIGGMKAVVWNDCFQLVIYLIGGAVVLGVIAQRLPDGVSQITTYAKESTRNIRFVDAEDGMEFEQGSVRLTPNRMLTARLAIGFPNAHQRELVVNYGDGSEESIRITKSENPKTTVALRHQYHSSIETARITVRDLNFKSEKVATASESLSDTTGVEISTIGHVLWFDFTLSLKQSMSFWAGLIGGMFLAMGTHGVDQMMVQRLLAARSRVDASIALIASGFLVCLQFAFFLFVGVALCCYTDHTGGEWLSKTDRALANFVVHEMPKGLGLVGIILAGIFAAAMSTLSSSLNSSATVVVNDFLKIDDGSNQNLLFIGKWLTAIFGAVQIGIAIAASQVTSSVITEVLGIAGLTVGALLGLFALSRTKTGQVGAIGGLLVGALTLLFVYRQTEIAWPWYAFIGSTTTFVFGLLIGLLSKKND